MKQKIRRMEAVVLAMALLMALVTGMAEESDLIEMRVEEVEVCLGAPEEPAAPPAPEEGMPDMGEQAVAAPAEVAPMEAVPMEAAPTTAVSMVLTGKDSVTMNVGDTLIVSVADRQIKSLKSSKAERVLCADDGTVTAVAEGSAKITVTATDGRKFKLSVKVVDPFKPEAVSLSCGEKLQMTLQDTIAITPVLAPETARATFTWKSSRPAVLTVENGVLKPIKEGTATVTVRTQNRKSAKVKVRVVDPFKPDSVALDITGTVTVRPGESFALTPSVSPATAQPTYTWKSSKSAVASVDSNGVVTALSKGTAKVSVTTQNKKTAKVTVKVVSDQQRKSSGAPMRMSASRYKYFRKYMSQSEFDAALATVQPYLEQLLDMPVEDQVCGVWNIVSSFGFDYSMSTKHYNDPYGLLVLGVASCAGTTRTVGFCLNLLGIEYEHVHENKYDHQWTRVMVDGQWWICDGFGVFGYCGPEGDPNQPISVYGENGNLIYVTYAYMSDEALNETVRQED